MFGWSPIPTAEMSEKMGLATFDKMHTRVSGLPDSYGFLPSSALYDEIMVPGEGQIRAFAMIGCNSVVSGPSGPPAGRGARGAGHVLRHRPLHERDQQVRRLHPAVHDDVRAGGRPDAVPRPVHPAVAPGHREGRRASRRMPAGVGDPRRAGRADGPRRRVLNAASSAGWPRRSACGSSPARWPTCCCGPARPATGSGCGARAGRGRSSPTKAPHGVVLHEDLPLRPLKGRLQHPDKRIHLADPRVIAEIARSSRAGPGRRPRPSLPADRHAGGALPQLVDAQLREAHAGLAAATCCGSTRPTPQALGLDRRRRGPHHLDRR